MKATLTIGTVAREAGVGVETVRFYERRGLLEQPRKSNGSGLRIYPEEAIARIRFIRQAQGIGFSLRQVEELLSLRTDPEADCASVREHAQAKIAEVDEKVAELRRVRAALERVVQSCPGMGGLQGCTILSALDEMPPLAGRTRAQDETNNMKEGSMKSVTFKVEGMHCEGCAQTIKNLVSAEKGVQAASVSLPEREAHVLYDPAATDEDQLVAAVQRPGYRVVERR